MSNYLLSLFPLPESSDVRLTVVPLAHDVEQTFEPVVTSRRALAEALALLPHQAAVGRLHAALSGSEPLQVSVTQEVLQTLFKLLEPHSRQAPTPIH